MRIEKKIGPEDEPCGTPEITGRNSDTSSFQTTSGVRPDIYECTDLIALAELSSTSYSYTQSKGPHDQSNRTALQAYPDCFGYHIELYR